MRVGLKSDIFKGCTDETWVALNYLLYVCTYKNRHEVILEGQLPDKADKYLGTDFAQLLKFTGASYVNGAEPDCKIMKNGDNYLDKPWFSIDEGIRYLSQPFMLVLENSKNDAIFIETLIGIYGRNDITRAIKNGWMYYVNAGGCTNVPNFIQGLMSQYQDKKKFLRCYVILDSDALYPAHDNPKSSKTKQYLRENNIPHHIWEKRMMENYMPIEALPNGSWKNAFIHLSPEQKDHYAIHGGFKKEEKFACDDKRSTHRSDLIAGQAAFYSDVSAANYKKLEKGYEIPNFKDEYPARFLDRRTVNRETLNNRISHQNNPHELETVLEEIAQHLAM